MFYKPQHLQVVRPRRRAPSCPRAAFTLFPDRGDTPNKPKASVPAAATTVTRQPAAPEVRVAARKPVQPVPAAERPTVQLLMHLAELTARVDTLSPSQLVEHGLQLVTTSADNMDEGAAALGGDDGSDADEYAAMADGMAPLAPEAARGGGGGERLADVAQALQQRLQRQLRRPRGGGSGGSDGPGTAWSAPRGGGRSLGALTAQADHDALSRGAAAAAASSVVAGLQGRLSRAAGALAPALGKASQAARATLSAVTPAAVAGGAAPASSSATAPPAAPTAAADLASRWLVADDTASATRFIVIGAPPALASAFADADGAAATRDLVTFERYSLGAKVNAGLYAEACALYTRFLPLVLDHLEEAGPRRGRVCLSGAGLGGSLASLLVLMLVVRGLRPGALAPAYLLNAPLVLCEVPDFAQWCSREGCSTPEEVIQDVTARGLLTELGLDHGAVRSVYYGPGAAGAGAGRATSAGAAGGGAGAAARRLGGWDAEALAASHLVPGVVKGWLRSGDGGGGKASPSRPALQILNPVGRVMVFTP